MTVGASARRTAFWTLDRARGGSIRRHLEDIRESAAGRRDPMERLQPLLEHAIRTTPFYAEVGTPRLHAFPVATRPTIQRRPEAFHSAAFKGARLREVTTSGSSGRPMTVRQDRGKRSRSIADTIHANEMCGLFVGDPLLWMKAWGMHDTTGGLVRRAQNVTMFEVRGLDDARTQSLVDTLRDRTVNGVLAYASALEVLHRFIEARGIDARAFGLRVIISDSETLPRRVKRDLEATFGCPVADRYANEENGILALARPGDDQFRLNRASYVFEFLDLHTDEPQRAGQLARVVITDLYNYAMPLIRYDTGDLAVAASNGDRGPATIERLEGRRMDLVHDTAGRVVSSTMLATAMDPFDRLSRYQLVQLDPHAFRLCVVGADGIYTSEQLTSALEALLGEGTRIVVDHVADIPAEASGKMRVLVPLEPPSDGGPGAVTDSRPDPERSGSPSSRH